jgi:YegS/Rv2252/BmrU family lipid kinase
VDTAVEGKPLVLLVNPSSGHGRAQALLPKVERELDKRRIGFRVERTQDATHAVEEALHAVELGEVPVVMSGDGLIGIVGGALAGAEVPLGIVPSGRGNDLARVLGVPTDPAGAVGVLEAGETRRIDIGEANGQRFLGIASVGFDSDANRIANQARLFRGNLVYAYAAIRALAGWKSARFTVRAGEDRLRFTGWGVAVANNKAYGGGMYAAPDAMLDDGEFDIVTLGDIGKFAFVRTILLKVFKGTHIEEDAVKVFRAPFVELSASRPFAVYADGEHLTDLPASLRILPGALNVIAPPAGA